MRVALLASMLTVLATTCVAGTSATASLPAYLSAADATSLTEWLRLRPKYLLAMEEDCNCSEEIARAANERRGLAAPGRESCANPEGSDQAFSALSVAQRLSMASAVVAQEHMNRTDPSVNR